MRDRNTLGPITNEVRDRLARGLDVRGLKARYTDIRWRHRSFDEALYLHPAFTSLQYVDSMTRLYEPGGE